MDTSADDARQPLDDGRRPFRVFGGESPQDIQMPMWPMLRADVSPAARCLVPLIIANSYRVADDQAPVLTTEIISRMIGTNYEAAVDELTRIGFLTVHGASLTFHAQPPAGYEGPCNLGEACVLYGDSDLFGPEGGR